MELIKINSFLNLQDQLKVTERSFLLLYKSETENSACAINNLISIDFEKNNFNVLIADVNHVRDIHEKYDITTVPSLLEFDNRKLVRVTKGCHEPDFFKSLFENSLYSVTEKAKDEKIKQVTVYTTPTCPHCTTLKNYLKDHKIRYRDIDVSKDEKMAQYMVNKSGQQGVPQIEINGKIIVGFNRPKIDEMLEIR